MDNITPQQIMAEVARLYNKLKDGEATTKTMTPSTSSELINGKIVYTDVLKLDNLVIAQTTRIDSRPLETIKAEAEQQKIAIEEQVIAKVDEVIAMVDAEIGKQSAKQ